MSRQDDAVLRGVAKAYDLQASCYITKPEDLKEFHRVVGSIKDFCLTVVKLPPKD
jgi:hypothetical protein